MLFFIFWSNGSRFFHFVIFWKKRVILVSFDFSKNEWFLTIFLSLFWPIFGHFCVFKAGQKSVISALEVWNMVSKKRSILVSKSDKIWQILVLQFWHEFLVFYFRRQLHSFLNCALKKQATTTCIRGKNDPLFLHFSHGWYAKRSKKVVKKWSKMTLFGPLFRTPSRPKHIRIQCKMGQK